MFEQYDGERNPGELGYIRSYKVDYSRLSARAWQTLLDSETVSTFVNRMCLWMVGNGLKLQAEPIVDYLSAFNIEVDLDEFNKRVEAAWKVYSTSKMASIDGEQTLGQIAYHGKKNSFTAGDVLVVLRVVNGIVKVELIDGQLLGGVSQPDNKDNSIIAGVEYDKNGQHVRYHYRDKKNKTNSIKAYSKEGWRMAYIYQNTKHRLNDKRGLSGLATVIETASRLQRYQDATLQNAEAIKDMVYAFKHSKDSTGEDPILPNVAQAAYLQDGEEGSNSVIDPYTECTPLSNKLAATTGKESINLPVGASLEIVSAQNELYFKDFNTSQTNMLASGVGIPPDVGKSQYENSFSSSRAALKDWGITLDFDRNMMGSDFYQPIYNLQLTLWIASGYVKAPGYLKALLDKNEMILSAYRHARWKGVDVPHIDPVKEINAIRLKLGKALDSFPITTLEKAAESADGNDYLTMLSQLKRELDSVAQTMGVNINIGDTPEKPEVPGNGNPTKEPEEIEE